MEHVNFKKGISQDFYNNIDANDYIDFLNKFKSFIDKVDWNTYNHNALVKYENYNANEITQPIRAAKPIISYAAMKTPAKAQPTSIQRNDVRYSSLLEAWAFEVGPFVPLDFNTKINLPFYRISKDKVVRYVPDCQIQIENNCEIFDVNVEIKGAFTKCDDYGQKYVDIKRAGIMVILVLQEPNVIIPSVDNYSKSQVTQEEFLTKNNIPFVYIDDIPYVNYNGNVQSFVKQYLTDEYVRQVPF